MVSLQNLDQIEGDPDPDSNHNGTSQLFGTDNLVADVAHSPQIPRRKTGWTYWHHKCEASASSALGDPRVCNSVGPHRF